MSAVVRDRWVGWSGLAFVVLFLAGFFIWETPDTDGTAAEWAEWFDDSGNRATLLISAFLTALAGVAFIPFLVGLRDRMLRAGGSPTAASIALVAGAVFLSAVFLAQTAWSATALAIEFGDLPVPDGDFPRMFEQIGFVAFLIFGAFSAGLFVATVSAVSRRTGLLPRWLANAGLAVSVTMIAGAFFIPMGLLFLWLLATSIALIRSNGTPSREPEEPGAAEVAASA